MTPEHYRNLYFAGIKKLYIQHTYIYVLICRKHKYIWLYVYIVKYIKDAPLFKIVLHLLHCKPFTLKFYPTHSGHPQNIYEPENYTNIYRHININLKHMHIYALIVA